ncbi:hypothetical protein CEXT_755711 [Caerostris extrusa]|uniref:Uncharacterized protein n=1 Tax=Caerostris extrusa TaxID=172846 RepID=A0AAV4TI78_CAEEX|nr:hypothetical protein CEXT_755711 [Caerostris extrusa]
MFVRKKIHKNKRRGTAPDVKKEKRNSLSSETKVYKAKFTGLSRQLKETSAKSHCKPNVNLLHQENRRNIVLAHDIKLLSKTDEKKQIGSSSE